MTARLRSWWQKIRKPLGIIGIIAAGIGLVILIVVEVRLYGTGFKGKTLWDWLGLLAALAIPAVVGLGAAWFTAQQGKVSEQENKDNQRETALQGYIDKISNLLLKEHLGELPLSPEQNRPQIQVIARARTVTILRILDPARRGSLIRFLSQAGILKMCIEEKLELAGIDLRGANLIRVDLRKINLDGADLTGANLREANLYGASLRGADLTGTDLSGASLSEADLRGAILYEADLRGVNLHDASLSEADLCGADLRGAILSRAKLSRAKLSRAILYEADLSEVSLYRANLSNAYLTGSDLTPAQANADGADLTGADLTGVIITEEQLKQAKSLKGATMSNGSKHS